ncbi:hypothetical protein LINPERHAP2_LOCUS6063 [Linum perenne]
MPFITSPASFIRFVFRASDSMVKLMKPGANRRGMKSLDLSTFFLLLKFLDLESVTQLWNTLGEMELNVECYGRVMNGR